MPDKPAASTDASSAPASEPGTSDKRHGHGGNAETRIRELLEENRRLKAAVPAAAPATSPAVSSPAAPAMDSIDPRPDSSDLTKYPDGQWDSKFIEDMSRWAARDERRQADTLRATQERERARTEHLRERNTKFTERLQAATTADPSFRDAIAPDVLSLRPTDALQPGEAPSALNALADELVASEHAPQIMRHLSANPDELRRFAAFRTPAELLRAFVALEHKVAGGSASTTPKPEPPKLSSAPPPPVSLEGRQHTPADPLQRAVVGQDFNAYRAAKLDRLRAGAR